MRISERLKLLCSQQGWRIKDFAELTGLPYRTAQGYISGDREPNSDGMTILVEKLNININWLLTGKGVMFIDPEESKQQSFIDSEIHLISEYRKANGIGKKIILSHASLISKELKNEK
ncbi:helix-turn-helix domain-containing protein [Gallibacterium melopsittaci]|uniref:Helix-turn-helix domain-containing protein n=1 Tax=Gallibacterium melopsittaci TaxID=516063 RepID=A0ABV6HYJ9_9PAST